MLAREVGSVKMTVIGPSFVRRWGAGVLPGSRAWADVMHAEPGADVRAHL